MPLGYELVADSGALSSSVTQYDFTGLNYTKDDTLLLVSDCINATTTSNYYLYVNSLTSTYYNQKITASSSSVSASRVANSSFASVSTKTFAITDIKLSENGYFTWISKNQQEYGGSSVVFDKYYGTKTASVSTITSISIVSSVSNAIGIGTRFKLYKLIAEPIADVIVSSDTTRIDITSLSLNKTNELLLISDIINPTGVAVGYTLDVNNNTTSTNYYTQELTARLTSVLASRANRNRLTSSSSSDRALIYSNIKLTNNDYFNHQSRGSLYLPSSSIEIRDRYCTSTFTLTTLIQLTINSTTTNSIGVGSRFTLYKLK